VPCPNGKSCYPGTCENNACRCPPQFSGDDCQKFRQTPDVSECRVQLFSGSPETEVAKANCAVEGAKPELNWVRTKDFTRILANWEATYSNRYSPVLPTSTRHIQDAKFGVTFSRAEATLNVSTSAQEEPSLVARQVTCKDESEYKDPRENLKCSSREIKWAEFGRNELPDNSTIKVAITAKLGGFKKPKNNPDEPITSDFETTRLVIFTVDSTPPWHCRKVDCEDPTMSLKSDAVQDPVIEGNFTNWYDWQSGIDKYCVDVYQLLKAGNILEPSQHRTAMFCSSGVTSFQYTIPSPGVFSLLLTVYDKANNTATARKIVLFDKENGMKKTGEPLRLNGVPVESGYGWLTTFPRNSDDGNSRLTLNWKGRYTNQKHLSEGWLLSVRRNYDIFDDNLLKTDGRRTIHEIKHDNGTVGCRLAFKVDQQGGRDPHTSDIKASNISNSNELEPSTWAFFDHTTQRTTLVIPGLNSNHTIVIWIQAFDVVGYSFEDQIKISFDNTPPKIDTAVLVENAIDPYTSRVEIKAEDLECGIKEVRYWISTKLSPNFTSGTASATRLISDGNRRKRALAVCEKSNSDCYCIRSGDCFARTIQVEIDHCKIDQLYRDDQRMEMDYVVVNQADQPVRAPKLLLISFQNGPPTCRPVVAFTSGVLLAIAVGCFILIALIVIAIFMVLRWKQDKHPVPDRVRTFAASMRQRITHTEKVLSSDGHAIYRAKTRRHKADEEDDDIYVDGSDPGGWRVKRDQVEMADTLAEGRFATVKKAYLKKGGETMIVAAKYLPAGASDSHKTLLRAKIAFHGNRVPPHDNIVRLVGVIDEGPIMLLEFCDLTLKGWLSNVGKVTTDVLENMLNFTSHIASGMEFLHSKNILHRRLAMRNVLLKKDGMNGLVAKLIGFGTFNDSGTEDQAEDANVAVPLKWLAPETLESVGKGKVVYTQKSDVWAYGVTIWEIYSIGATPYPGKKSAEVEALLKTGHRMPCPEECPPEMFSTVVTPCWNVVAKKRPDFKTLCKSIRSFRSGGDQQEGYYAAGPQQRSYDNPKERTNDYTSGPVGKSATKAESLYDDTRK